MSPKRETVILMVRVEIPPGMNTADAVREITRSIEFGNPEVIPMPEFALDRYIAAGDM